MGRFAKATKERANLRCAMFGPSGAGKTFTALRIATGLGGPIGVICTERHAARKYSDRFSFDVLDLERRTIDDYVQAIRDAAKEGFATLIIDSLSHGWQELLEQIDKLAKTAYKGNSWGAWSEGTPKQKELINAILSYPGHVIATMRSKTEWTVTERNGRSAPDRVGLAPEQGKGIEYEFDLLIELNTEHMARVIKDRTGRFQDAIMTCPGEEFGVALAAWLSDGVAAAYVPPTAPIESAPQARLAQESRKVQPSDGAIPTDGASLFGWCKAVQQDNGIDILKYLNQWGKSQGFHWRLTEWDAETVALAYAEATRKLRSINIAVDEGQGSSSAHAPDAAHQPKSAESYWSIFATAFSRTVNTEWLREMDEEGVEEDARRNADVLELTNVFRLANAIASKAMEDGSITHEMIAHPDDQTKRSMKRIMAAITDIYVSCPEWVFAVCNAHVEGKRAEYRVRLGLDEPPAAEPPAATTQASEAAPDAPPSVTVASEPTVEPPAVPTEPPVGSESNPIEAATEPPINGSADRPEPSQVPKERARPARNAR